MRALLSSKRLIGLTLTAPSSSSSSLFHRTLTTYRSSLRQSPNTLLHQNLLESPWTAIQHRGAKVLGIDVRVGNVVQRKGRIYQVLKAQHTQQGRGGATIQVELRDVNSGSKLNERFRCEESLEKVFVEEKFMTFLYSDGDVITLMEPDTFEQIEVSKDLFGMAAVYLQDDMQVTLQLYDGRPMSATVPKRVTCKVLEAREQLKGTITPHISWVCIQQVQDYKRVVLDNGHTIMAPAFINPGDSIVIDTAEDSYITRSKE